MSIVIIFIIGNTVQEVKIIVVITTAVVLIGRIGICIWLLLLLLLLLLFTFISFNPIIVIYHQESQRGQSALAVATMKGHSEIVQFF